LNISKTVRESWRSIARAITQAFFPTKCLICGSFFHINPDNINGTTAEISAWIQDGMSHGSLSFDRVMTPFLCEPCSAGFVPIVSPMCIQCGVMFKSREGEDHVCGECIKNPKKFGISRALGIYDKTLMAVIHCFKYKGKVQLTGPLSTLLFFAFLLNWRHDCIDLIVPVPLHVKRLRERGFNQALLLIKDWPGLTKSMNIHMPNFEIDYHSVVRSKWTQPQTGLNKKQRMENIKKAFSVVDSDKIKSKRVLLVDDVYTTGATVDACAGTILRAGAQQVDVLTLARALRSEPG